MFGIFKKKTAVDKLDTKYNKLMKEAHRLSTIDRRASDAKVSEANQVLEKIEEIEGQKISL